MSSLDVIVVQWYLTDVSNTVSTVPKSGQLRPTATLTNLPRGSAAHAVLDHVDARDAVKGEGGRFQRGGVLVLDW